MKKISTYFLIVLLSIVVFLLGFDYKANRQPYTYYQVYLDDDLIGIIESKKELETYINSQAETIRDNVRAYKIELESIDTLNKYESYVPNENYTTEEKINYLVTNEQKYNLTDLDIENLNLYKNKKLDKYSNSEIQEMREYIDVNKIYEYADEVYTPNGIEIRKIYTYHNDLISVEEIYKQIISKKSCTISGYKFTIKNEEDKSKNLEIYTMDTNIFSSAIEDLITIFVDDKEYELYKKGEQKEISTTGSLIENIYVNEDITYKAVNIPVEERIFTDSKDLSAYLLYGDKFQEKQVKVKSGDSIESLAFDNEISVQEFLIFNPQYTSRENLLVPGTDVIISNVDPKIQIVVETYEVVDKETNFQVVEQYDSSLTKGSVVVKQEGQKGLERVTQNVKSMNGVISYVDPVDKEVLKSPVSKIINIGTKYVPNIGSTGSWGWPTNSGYTISSYYGYRTFAGSREFHNAIDIAGTGYGSNIYAANNGVIEIRAYNSSYGNYIMINHNNGYYSLYAHMSSFAKDISVGSTVSRGQVIGYVGSTGRASGPHLHFEIRNCARYACVTNPLSYYR